MADYFDEQEKQQKEDLKQASQEAERMAREKAMRALKEGSEVSKEIAAAEGETATVTGLGGASSAAAGSTKGIGATVSGAQGAVPAAETSGAASGAAGGAAGGSAAGGIGAGWWVLIIIVIIAIIIICLFLISGALIALFSQNQNGVTPNNTVLSQFSEAEQTMDNAAYVLALIESNSLVLESYSAGTFDNDYAKNILQACVDEEDSRAKKITVSYEGVPWVLIADADGNTLDSADYSTYHVDPDGDTYTNQYGTWQEGKIGNTALRKLSLNMSLTRRDIEDSSFDNNAFDDPYMLRWQAVFALCQLRIANTASKWGATDAAGNEIKLTMDMMADGTMGNFFLKDGEIEECIDCFCPQFYYLWNPLESVQDGTSFSYDDTAMKVYRIRDERDEPYGGGNANLGSHVYVFQYPVIAPSRIDLGYRKITYYVDTTNAGRRIDHRTIQETPGEWMAKLEAAAGGYFDKDRFLYYLSLLPNTEHMIEEYRYIFEELEDGKRYDDYSVTVPAIGAYVRGGVVPTIPTASGLTTGLPISYTTAGESVILEMRAHYINQGTYDVNSGKTWGRARRGDGTYTIGGAGCIDCCYAMCSYYFNGTCLPMEVVSTRYVIGQSFYYGDFCNDFQMSYRTDPSIPLPTEAVKRQLKSGNLVIMQIKGYWGSVSGRGNLHGQPGNTSTHYIVIYGYDMEGFYLCDPGSRSNSANGPIPYADMNIAPLVECYFINSKNQGFVPSYAVYNP